MKLKLQGFLSALLLTGCLLTGCVPAHFYPIQGPLVAALQPATSPAAPLLHGKLSGVFNSGSITIRLESGEVCTGHWAIVHPGERPQDYDPTGAPPAASMPAAWDTVFGTGYYTTHVVGAHFNARAIVSGTRGTVFNIEMYRPRVGPNEPPINAVRAVALDNYDNIYKLVL